MDDIFRKETRTLSKGEQDHLNVIKEQAEVLLDLFIRSEGVLEIQTSRELSVARTKLEEAVMWAVKHWTA